MTGRAGWDATRLYGDQKRLFFNWDYKTTVFPVRHRFFNTIFGRGCRLALGLETYVFLWLKWAQMIN